MLQTYSYGHDFGNAETCGVTYVRGKKFSKSIPSATAQGTLSELENLGVHLASNDFVFKDAATELYVGNLALSQSGLSFTGRGDINRYWSKKSLYLLLTVAGSMIEDAEFALNVVAGLPVQTYIGDPDSRKRVKEALEGEYKFFLNGQERFAHIRVERVIMEGAGAIVAYGSKDRVVQGVIDIGGRTTDLFASSGQTPFRQYCDGKQLGVEIAADVLSRKFHNLYGRTLKQDERRAILRAYASHGNNLYPRLHAQGQEITNLKTLTHDALQEIGNEIASFVSTTWNESETGSVASSFALVLLVGGGAYYFQDQIQRVIPHVQTVQSPEEANALGYAAFAEGQLQRIRSIA